MAGYPLHRNWVYDRHYSGRAGLKPSFVDGVHEFIRKAIVQPDVKKEGGIRCPCDNCRCANIESAYEVTYHLCKFGFQPNYWYWTEHGEVEPHEATTGTSSHNDEDRRNDSTNMMNEDPFIQMQDMVHNACGPSYNFEGMYAERNEEEEEIHEEPPNKEAQDFYDLLISANQPLYEGASESRLSICVKLLACKTNWNVPEKCLDFFASMLRAVCPSKDTLPTNYYQAKRLVSMLGLKAQKIDCCPNGCILYYKDKENDRECKFCNAQRYIPCNIGIGRRKEVSAKRMVYFPITPRLKRLYASIATAAEMRWHHENKSRSNILRHPSDGAAWKHFNAMYPDFANEPRNVRLGLCSDGFTPYIQASSTPYSCWPVIVTPYNLPPEMCMTKPFMFLSCIIPGPDNPKIKIDVFLQPLIDELKELWSVGSLTYDISKKQNFLMRASLMWTINDFPAYGMLSGWSTHGKLSCPLCMNDIKSFWLKYGGKNSWFDCHRRFLQPNHTFRKSRKRFTSKRVEKDGPPNILTGDEIWDLVCDLPSVVVDGDFGKLPGFGVSHNWKKRSIFWDLPYWKDNLLRHNMDVMHIEKNFFDNVFHTVMDDKDKTKDNMKARMDMAITCTRSDLELVPKASGKGTKPKATYCLSSAESKNVYRWIKQLKMPDGYASNLARCANVNNGRMYNMKSHDCHVFMECLLPFAFASLDDIVWRPLTELSQFFKGLCSNTLRQEELIKLDANIPVILCQLERIFPPGFFDSMEHLPVHLPKEAMLGGPVQYRWMYPFERMMGDFKRTVKNKARVEGSICMSYLQRETTFFCSHFFKAGTLINTSRHNEGIKLDGVMTSTLSISNHLGRPRGTSKDHWLKDVEWRSAHIHVLINCNEVKPYIDVFLQALSINEQDHTAQTRIHEEFPEWFRNYATDESNGISDENLIALAWGPESKVTSWYKYIVNGYKFHTEAWSEGKKTMNCGVYVKGVTEGGEDDFYGVIHHIYELEYHRMPHKVALFACKWFNPKRNRGTKVHPQYDIVDINMDLEYDRYDPFILVQEARQVYYVPYPLSRKDKHGWCAVIKTKPRGYVEVDNLDEDVPFQDEEIGHIEPITEIEDLIGLHDTSHGEEEEVDIPFPTVELEGQLDDNNSLEEEMYMDVDVTNMDGDDDDDDDYMV